MSRDEAATEAEIQAKGLNAPRLQPTDIDAAIVSADYHVFPGTRHTVCCLTLRNGFTVIGESSSVSSENFDVQIGRNVAYQDARQSVWALEGYRLKQHLYDTQLPKAIE